MQYIGTADAGSAAGSDRSERGGGRLPVQQSFLSTSFGGGIVEAEVRRRWDEPSSMSSTGAAGTDTVEAWDGPTGFSASACWGGPGGVGDSVREHFYEAATATVEAEGERRGGRVATRRPCDSVDGLGAASSVIEDRVADYEHGLRIASGITEAHVPNTDSNSAEGYDEAHSNSATSTTVGRAVDSEGGRDDDKASPSACFPSVAASCDVPRATLEPSQPLPPQTPIMLQLQAVASNLLAAAQDDTSTTMIAWPYDLDTGKLKPYRYPLSTLARHGMTDQQFSLLSSREIFSLPLQRVRVGNARAESGPFPVIPIFASGGDSWESKPVSKSGAFRESRQLLRYDMFYQSLLAQSVSAADEKLLVWASCSSPWGACGSIASWLSP